MKKTIFKVIVTLIVWFALTAPLLIPDEIKGYHPCVLDSKSMFKEPYNTWAYVGVVAIIAMALECISQLADKLYEYLRK